MIARCWRCMLLLLVLGTCPSGQAAGAAVSLATVSYAGLALILLGVALMLAEVLLPSFGVVGLGGIVAFVVGAVTIARQAEAERERRAKVIHAEGELQASEKLMQAAQMLGREQGAMQLRYMQTLGSIAGDKSSTIVFPMPMDLLKGLVDRQP
ncbi:Skp family chaperone for outer membrane proteins [Pseudomonas sp. BP8]|nr:Skp family chaperone for outer membrane proteins [Pseudomonas sp. BP8]